MNREYLSPESAGFHGVYYPNPNPTNSAMIVLLGDSSDDRLAISGARWVQGLGCNALAMSPDKKDYGHHSYPMERFEAAVHYLRQQGNQKIGITGASTTGMVALVAASICPDITLTIAVSPPDFIMEGFYQDGKDGAKERPGENESSLTYRGKPLPYLPYAYRHPLYWQMIRAESKAGGDVIASRKMFEESERLHPIREEERIRVEDIKGKLVLLGAEDDVLWDTCTYIRRMEKRLQDKPHDCRLQILIYPHGTHFIFPQSLLNAALPLFSGLLPWVMFRAARRCPKECKKVRLDVDRQLSQIIRDWQQGT